MARKQPARKPAAPKARSDIQPKPGADSGALDEQDLNKVTGGDNPTESISFNFGTIKQS